MRAVLLAFPLVALATAGSAEDLPLNTAVAQENIGETICAPGWTKIIRPPFKVTNATKLAKLGERGLTAADKSPFELDHIIPLALGGAPGAPRNLALQPWPEAEDKDAVEACLARARSAPAA